MEQSDPSTFGILDLVQGAGEVCAVPAADRDVGQWMDLIGEVSAAMTVLAAARDAAIVRLAAIEEVVTEDGVIGEQVNGLGTVGIDAGAMVSTATATTARFGEEMVEQAVTRVVRVPALHEAMLSGVLDDYKARAIAAELADVPPELARTVVDVLGPQMGEKSGPALRRRTRTILFKVAPELLKERIRKARNNVSLRRWLGEPGTDAWGAVFPSERAASTWAAVDALARQYKADGTYPTLEQSRAYALLDLVDGSTTVTTVLHLTVPADALDEAAAESDSYRETASADALNGAPSARGAARREGGDCAADPAPTDPQADAARSASAATPASAAPSASATPASAAPSASAATPASSTETFVATTGTRPDEVSWMPLITLPSAERVRATHASALLCHPRTGALIDVGDALSTEAYRPGKALKQLIQQRDRRCRFPGCTVPSRQCDIDHVIAWPNGPTAATNLICLCRRHHRVKQRHRWRVRLLKNGVVEWVDPVGRQLTTEPVDHLLSTQIRVTQVGPPTAEDLAELLEWELIVAQFDEDAAPGPACTHDQHCESNEHSSTAAVGGSRPEAAMAQAVADVLRSLARAQPQESSDSLSGGLSPTAKPWHGKPQPRFGAHTCDLDRIPRPQRQGGPDIGAHRTGGSGRRAGKPGGRAGKSGLDGADSNVTIDCRFDAGGRLGVGRVRYRASRRHRRWAKYLAAGGPPF